METRSPANSVNKQQVNKQQVRLEKKPRWFLGEKWKRRVWFGRL